MKRILLLSIPFLLLLCFSELMGQGRPIGGSGSRVIASSAPLPGGTNTIGGAGPTFATFAAALLSSRLTKARPECGLNITRRA